MEMELTPRLSHYKGKAPFIGMFMMFTPYLLIVDPQLIKQILINKFKHFRNNDFTVSGSFTQITE